MSRQDPAFDASLAVGSQDVEGLVRFRRAGDFVFVASVGGPEGAGIQAQTNTCILKLSNILEEAGGGLENLVELVTYLARMTDFTGYNEAYGKHFSVDGPARTTIAVEQLSHPEMLIEMRGVAYIAKSTSNVN